MSDTLLEQFFLGAWLMVCVLLVVFIGLCVVLYWRGDIKIERGVYNG